VTYLTDTHAQAVITADLNGDGVLDLITANADTLYSAGLGVSVLLGLSGRRGAPTGTFAPVRNYEVGPAEALAVGDLNGDHKLDIVTSRGGVLLNNGDGTFRIGPVYSGGLGSFIASADLNHDGKLDLITASNTGSFGRVNVLLGNGDGTFAAGPPLTVPPGLGQVVVGDFNRDSRLDIVETSGQAAYLLPGNGDGTFGPAQTIATFQNADANGILAMTAADFNADGKLDLAVTYLVSGTGGGAGTAAILLGNGDGTFHNAGWTPNLPGASPVSQQLAAADFNGDGKLDLVAVGVTPGYGISVFYGNGDGTFPTSQNFVPGATSDPLHFAVGDFNGDGYADIAVAGFDPYALEVFLWSPKKK
jgi:hypothetical protein